VRVLVTGAAGFIGFHVAREAIRKGHEVIAVDNLERGDPRKAELLSSAGCRFLRLDVRELRKHAASIGGIDAIIHCAALVSVEESFRKPLAYESVNVGGTVATLELAVRAGAERYVYLSSAAVYGDPVYLPIDENHPTRPKSPYGASKLAGELFAAAYAESYGIRAAILRLFNVYGPGQNPEYAGVIARFVEKVRMGEPPVIFGDGEQTRDFVHVVDVARAVLLSLDVDARENPLVVNIASGRPVSIQTLANIVVSLAGSKLKPRYAPPRPGDIRHSYAAIERAHKVLGWTPTISLEEGLRELLDLVRH